MLWLSFPLVPHFVVNVPGAGTAVRGKAVLTHAQLGVGLHLGDVHEVVGRRAVAALAVLLLAALLLTTLLLVALLLVALLLAVLLLAVPVLVLVGLAGVGRRLLGRDPGASGELRQVRGLSAGALDVDPDAVQRRGPLVLQRAEDRVLHEPGVTRLSLARRCEPGVGLGDLLVEVRQLRTHAVPGAVRDVRQLLADVRALDRGDLCPGCLRLVLSRVRLMSRCVEVRPDKPAPTER